jgi:hypothetical protein
MILHLNFAQDGISLAHSIHFPEIIIKLVKLIKNLINLQVKSMKEPLPTQTS